MNTIHNVPESSSPGKIETITTKFLTGSPRSRNIENPARVLFLGTLSEEEGEVHHRDHQNRAGCGMNRVAFMEEVWTVVRCYGIQSMLKTGLNITLMREILEKVGLM